MTDEEETIWSVTPHTLAKHQILEEYLKAWFPILTKWHGRVVYLDGFAGPGTYKGGEDGSPIIAIRTALNHKFVKNFGEIVFVFVEKEKDRAKTLEHVIESKFPNLPTNFKCEVKCAEFAPTLDSTLDGLEKEDQKLAPTFAFLDPFGFSGLPMKVVSRILKCERCEVLVTFMVGFLNRFAENQYAHVNELLDTKAWRKVLKLRRPEERERSWINLYETQLKKHGAVFVRSFQMVGENNQTIYYLVYGTRSAKGMEVMKEAMWKVDRRGTYSFSDMTDPRQTFVIDYSDERQWIPSAAERVLAEFHNQTVDVEVIHNLVITETRFLFRKSILKHMEQHGQILEVIGRQRKHTYPEGCKIRFSGH